MPRGQKGKKTLAKYLGVRGVRSAYIFYVNDNRPAKVEENPDASNTELVSLLAEDWKGLTDAQKRPYVKRAVKDRRRYEEELEKARTENPDKVEEYGKIKRKKVKREQYGVTGPRSAYIFFSTQQRPELRQEFPDEKMVEITKRIGGQWRELSDAAKVPFQKKAKKDRKRYEREFKNAKKAALAAAAAAAAAAEEDSTNENITTDATAETTPAPTARRSRKKSSKSSKK